MSTTFGQADHHYAVDQAAYFRTYPKPLTEMEKRFARLLERHDTGLKDQVERAFKQWNSIVRGHLRDETALKLTVGDDMQAVPVRVRDGLPKPLADILAGFDERVWSFLLNRGVLEGSGQGLAYLQDEFEWLSAWEPISPSPAQFDEVQNTSLLIGCLLEEIRKLNILEQIRAINQDVLGAYFFRVPEVQLYWMVIGFFAGWLGVPPDALTVSVAAHELAHAYTHLGRDLNREQWDTVAFAQTENAIVEGLAQFYTHVICKKLESRFPAAYHAYEALLSIQSGPYTIHKEWLKDSDAAGEVIRYSMVECRSKRIKDIASFELVRQKHLSELT